MKCYECTWFNGCLKAGFIDLYINADGSWRDDMEKECGDFEKIYVKILNFSALYDTLHIHTITPTRDEYSLYHIIYVDKTEGLLYYRGYGEHINKSHCIPLEWLDRDFIYEVDGRVLVREHYDAEIRKKVKFEI